MFHSLCAATYIAGKMEPALVLARQFVELADQQDDPIYRLVGYDLLGRMQLFTGQSREALASLEQAERHRDRRREKLLCTRFGLDPGLAVLSFKVSALMRLARLKQAAHILEQMRTELAGHSHAPTVAACTLTAVVFPEFALGKFEAFERHCAELAAFSTEKDWYCFVSLPPICMRAPVRSASRARKT
jgi:hypothetical protein